MIGRMLGPYRIDAEIGVGGMGRVYRACVAGRTRHVAQDTVVAVKVVHPHLLETPGFLLRFLREAEIGRKVVHENVVRTLDAGSAQVERTEHPFLVMEFVEGQTLRSLLTELGRVPEELCRHLGCEVAQGLAAIHAEGVVHRDLKPDNVLVTRSHAVKVMDLGVAQVLEDAVRLSQTGAFVGSIHYAAPEQFRGGVVDARADLHALGIVLYEIATARHPFGADGFREAMRRMLDDKPRRPSELNPQISPFFEDVVMKLLEKEPAERFASAGEVARVLSEGEHGAWWKDRAQRIRAATRRPLRRIRIPRETALIGREAELAQLRALYDRAKAGAGQVVLVEGEAGIGKSRLVDEFVGLLQQDGEDVNFLYGGYPPGGAATASGAFSTAYREHFGSAGLTETLRAYLRETPILVPAFAALLRGETAPEGAQALTKDSVQTVFVHATRALAAERPTVVLVDDLHFAPEEGRALFAALALAVPGHRVLLIGTSRPGADESWMSAMDRAGAARLLLARLGPKDLARLLVEALGSEHTADALALRIAQKSDGNPYFVFEILRGLRDGNLLVKSGDGTWTTSRVLSDFEIPASVAELVQARIANLDDDDRNLLEAAACQGFEFDARIAAEVLGMGRVPVLQRLGRIEKRHRLVRSVGDRFVFDHHQVQEALYDGISNPLRQEYHALVAAAMVRAHGAEEREPRELSGTICVELADHSLRGAQGESAKRYLGTALAHLEARYANDAALRLAERALAVPGLFTEKERCELLVRKAARLDLLARRPEERAALDEAVALADALGDVELRARTRSILSWHLVIMSRHAESEVLLADALAIARAAGDAKAEALALKSLGAMCFSLSRYEEALVHFDRVVEIQRARGDLAAEAHVVMSRATTAWSAGRFEQAGADIDRFVSRMRETGDRRSEALGLASRAGLAWCLGRLEETRDQIDRALEIMRETGDRRLAALNLANRGQVLLVCGRPDAARAALLRSRALCAEIGDRWTDATAVHNLGLHALETGDFAGARLFFEEAVDTRRAIGHHGGAADTRLELAALRLEEGDSADARRHFDDAATLLAGAGSPSTRALVAAERARLPGGGADEALALLAEHGAHLDVTSAMRVRFRLWQATGDRVHLTEAKRLLDHLVAHAPAEDRGTMIGSVRLHREIAAPA